MRPLVVCLAAAALAACDSDGAEPPPRDGIHSPEGVLIRDWLMALDRGDYGQAASFFAPHALIDQGDPFRLRGPAHARFFNATLPCRANLIRLLDEGRQVLASFRLRTGPGGPCTGVVRVRYTIRGGRFTEWRQLEADGQAV